MRRRSVWIAMAVAAIGVLGAIAVSTGVWRAIGGSEISANGWIAMALGALVSLGLGIGLMALVFFSNRRGYD